MPRSIRKKSKTGLYHVMLRGINRQNVFEDEEDNEKFLDILRECKGISGFKLFAYCLMGNHVHLLIKEEKEGLELIFKRLGARFVYWYNRKYGRTGHLFQDRFNSEPVESDIYFLTVLRYIHQNPVKAGLCLEPAGYKWSSYNNYIKGIGISDTEFGLSMFSDEQGEAIKRLSEFTKKSNADQCMEEIYSRPRLTEREAKEKICELCDVQNPQELQHLDTAIRDKNISSLKKNGLSIRQISRLTGISFGIVRK